MRRWKSGPRYLTNPFLPVERIDGPGVFETMRSYGGRILALDMHVDRLWESAAGIGRAVPWTKRDVRDWITGAARASREPDAMVRVLVSFSETGNTILAAFVRPFAGHPARLYRNGVAVRTSSVRKSAPRAQSPQVKSNQVLGAVFSFLETRRSRFFETLFLNREGFLTEGTVSNFFVAKRGRLFTPAPSCGILLGVTRHRVIKAARASGLACEETILSRHDLYCADEAFLTTTLAEVMPVVRCDARRIGEGRPGPVTRRVHTAFRSRIDDD